jgi:probable addiction module antidote protein
MAELKGSGCRYCGGEGAVGTNQEGAKEMSKVNITPFDASEFLDSEETIAAYLADAFDSGNEDLILAALRDVAKARGMTKVASDAGVQRESLYKALGAGAKPRFDTILKVTKALGVKIAVLPMQAEAIKEAKNLAKPVTAKELMQQRKPAESPVAAKRASAAKTAGAAKTGRTPKAAHA